MEGERIRDVRGEVTGIVAAGKDVKFVGDFAAGEDFVKRGRADVETVIVLIATIEINFQAGEICGARQCKRTIGVPESDIRRNAEDSAEDASARGLRCVDESGEFFDERGAVSADGIEELRMAEGKMQSAVAAHRDSGNSAVCAAR